MGNPSGTATTISVTAIMRVFRVWASSVGHSALPAPWLIRAKAPHTMPMNRAKKLTMVRMQAVFDQWGNLLITSQKKMATGAVSVHAAHSPHPRK